MLSFCPNAQIVTTLAAAALGLLVATGSGCATASEDSASGDGALAAQISSASEAAAFVEKIATGDEDAIDRVEDVYSVPSSNVKFGSWSAYTLSSKSDPDSYDPDVEAPSETVFVSNGPGREIVYVDASEGTDALVVPDRSDPTAIRLALARDLRASVPTEGIKTASLHPLCCGEAWLKRAASSLVEAITKLLEKDGNELVVKAVKADASKAATGAAAKTGGAKLNLVATVVEKPVATQPAKVVSRSAKVIGSASGRVAKDLQLFQRAVKTAAFIGDDGVKALKATAKGRALIVDSAGTFGATVQMATTTTEIVFIKGGPKEAIKSGVATGVTQFTNVSLVSATNPTGTYVAERAFRVMVAEEAEQAALERSAKAFIADEGNLIVAGQTYGKAFLAALETVSDVYVAYPSRNIEQAATIAEVLLQGKTLHVAGATEKDAFVAYLKKRRLDTSKLVDRIVAEDSSVIP